MACDASRNGGSVQRSGLLACDHWEPSDGFADEGWHLVRTAIVGIVVAASLGYAVYSAKNAFTKKAEAEAAVKQAPTVIMPQHDDSTYSAAHRWCQ